MAWVYILKTGTGGYYVGSTLDLNKRIRHHAGGFTPTTKRLGFEECVFSQRYPSLSEARSVERKIKKLKRKDYIEKIVKDGYIKMRP